MAKQPKTRKGTTPQSYAPTTPPQAQAGHDFTLQAVMEMQKTLGAIGNKVDTVDKRVDDMSTELAKHGKWIFAANVVLAISVFGFGWVLTIIWDVIKGKFGI